MSWWLIWFVAALAAVGGKWYSAHAIERLRKNLLRQQRETLQAKEALTEARDAHHRTRRKSKERQATITRLKNRITDLQNEIERLKREQEESPR